MSKHVAEEYLDKFTPFQSSYEYLCWILLARQVLNSYEATHSHEHNGTLVLIERIYDQIEPGNFVNRKEFWAEVDRGQDFLETDITCDLIISIHDAGIVDGGLHMVERAKRRLKEILVDEDFLTVEEVSDLFKITIKTLYSYVQAGVFQSAYQLRKGGPIRFRCTELLEDIERMRVGLKQGKTLHAQLEEQQEQEQEGKEVAKPYSKRPDEDFDYSEPVLFE